MIARLRICVPEELSAAVLDCCTGELGVAEVSRQPGGSVLPPGDIIQVLLARESVEPLGLFPSDVLDRGSAVEFIYHPGPYSLIVNVLAGTAWMLSVISRRSAALIGVFISVTTVPAAGFVAVALVLGEYQKAAGSALQLGLNLSGIVASAAAVLVFYRLVTKRLPRGAALRLRRKAMRSQG